MPHCDRDCALPLPVSLSLRLGVNSESAWAAAQFDTQWQAQNRCTGRRPLIGLASPRGTTPRLSSALGQQTLNLNTTESYSDVYRDRLRPLSSDSAGRATRLTAGCNPRTMTFVLRTRISVLQKERWGRGCVSGIYWAWMNWRFLTSTPPCALLTAALCVGVQKTHRTEPITWQ